MKYELNSRTQKQDRMPVFNNEGVVSAAWYFVAASHDLKLGKVLGLRIADQYIVVFRGDDGVARALDGFCPHMGTDLSIGKVIGKRIQCFFHNWEFDGKGNCQKIPCGQGDSHRVRTQSYTVKERFGSIWVYPEPSSSINLPQYTEHDFSVEFDALHDKQYERDCHHHITMINGLDAQHLKTVHKLDLDMDVTIQEDDRVFDVELRGQLPRKNFVERAISFLMGGQYGYSMRYYDATVGLLTMMKYVKIFGLFEMPKLYLVFAYRPIENGRSLVQPIYVQPKREGLSGKLVNKFLLWLTKRAFYMLRDEDGKVYDNMRFSTECFLPIDTPVRRYVNYVNSLKPSVWSKETWKGESFVNTEQSKPEVLQ